MKTELQIYIDRKNAWADIINAPVMDINNLTNDQKWNLHDSIECDLSPENLHCDGEISSAEALKKAQFLNQAKQQLIQL